MSYQYLTTHYDQVFPFSEIKLSFLRNRFPAGCDCIDLGCGTGAYTSGLSSSGYNCIGLDLDRNMLQKANKLHPTCRFIELPMQEFDQATTQIDAAFCIGNTLAYLSPELLNKFLKKLSKALPRGGKWIFQIINWDFVLTQKEYNFPDCHLEGSINFQRWYDEISPISLKFHRKMMQINQQLSHEVDTLFPMTKEKLQKIHEVHGFQLSESFANFNQSEYVPTRDSALIMVFDKQ